VRHCRNSLCSIEAASAIRYLVDLHLLRVDVHAEDIGWLLGVAFLTHHALRSGLFDLLVYFLLEGTLLLLALHIGQDLLALKHSQLFLVIVLLVDELLQMVSRSRVVLEFRAREALKDVVRCYGQLAVAVLSL